MSNSTPCRILISLAEKCLWRRAIDGRGGSCLKLQMLHMGAAMLVLEMLVKLFKVVNYE